MKGSKETHLLHLLASVSHKNYILEYESFSESDIINKHTL